MSPDRAASATIDAYESKDPDALWRLTPDYEKRLYAGLCPQRLEKLLQLTGLGNDLTPTGPLILQEHPNDGSAVATRTYLLNHGGRFNWSAGAELREGHKAVVEGPVTSLIYMILYKAGLESGAQANPSGPVAEAYVAGIHRMGEKLRQIGFDGVADSEFRRILPWDEVEANLLTNHAFRMAR